MNNPKKSSRTNNKVVNVASAVVKTRNACYPSKPPFNPSIKYPEYIFTDIGEDNAVYEGIRELLIRLELNRPNYGTKFWNPLGEIIHPGDNVVIKPNFVSEPRGDGVTAESIVTHGSVLRPLIDYSLIALQGAGSLVVADAPQADSDIEKIIKSTGIKEVISFVNANSLIKVGLLDLRAEFARVERGVITSRQKLLGDPKGYSVIDLAHESTFHEVDDWMCKAYGSDYDYGEVRAHHTGGKHEYFISNTVLNADVVINAPKLKTHKKAGLTGCLKNSIGINGNKNYLPHFRFGAKNEGGDAYPPRESHQSVQSAFYQLITKRLAKAGPTELKFLAALRGVYALLQTKGITSYGAGDWHGNDTIWRAIVDLNKIICYADKSGRLQPDAQRKHLAVVDGVIGGEGNGPFNVLAKPSGVLIGAFNPVVADSVIATIMGFDWEKIPQIQEAMKRLYPNLRFQREVVPVSLDFQVPDGWDELKIQGSNVN